MVAAIQLAVDAGYDLIDPGKKDNLRCKWTLRISFAYQGSIFKH